MKRILFIRKSVALLAAGLIASALAMLPASAQTASSEDQPGSPTSGASSSSSSGGSSSNPSSGSMNQGSSSTSGATTSSGAALSEADRNFITQAAEGGMAEVRMGELGQEKATNSEVKSLAKTLQDDHQKANDELANIAKSKGFDMPSSMGSTHESAISALENKSGQDFDRAFVRDTIRDHKKDIAEFERAANDLQDPDLKAFAQKTVPILRNHLSSAEQASKSLGSSEKGEKSER